MSSTTSTLAAAEPAIGTRASAYSRWQWLAISLLAVEALLLYAPTVGWLYDRWTLSVWHHAHGLLVPPVVAYFAYQELKPLAHLPRSSSAWGFLFIIPALLLHAVDAGLHTQLLASIALMLALPGFSLLLLGTARTKAIAFPLVFIAFALPIPLALTEQIHWQLRQVATLGSSTVLPWLGIPVFVEGTTLHLSTGAVEIADACSGFSTLYAAAAIACLTAYTARSTKRRLLVLASAAPLAIGANLLRVISLVVLVVWQGEEILGTFIHPLSGLLTFALALPVIFWLGNEPPPKAQ